MFSAPLLDINKRLTNSILYKLKRPLQRAGVHRYCHYAKHSFRAFNQNTTQLVALCFFRVF